MKTVKVLDYIESMGSQGATFTQIQRYAFSLSHPGEPFTRENRGYWCLVLTNHSLDARFYKNILPTFTVKVNCRYIRNNRSHEEHPYAVMKRRGDRITAQYDPSGHYADAERRVDEEDGINVLFK